MTGQDKTVVLCSGLRFSVRQGGSFFLSSEIKRENNQSGRSTLICRGFHLVEYQLGFLIDTRLCHMKRLMLLFLKFLNFHLGVSTNDYVIF